MTSDTQTIRHMQQEIFRLRSENNSLKDYVERLQRALKALLTLQSNIDRITPKTNVFQLIHKILESALDAVDSEHGSLLLLDDESGELVFVEVIGEAREKLLNYRLPKGTGVSAWAVANREVRLVEDVSKEPFFSPQLDQYTGLNTTSLISVPLLDGDRPIGAIEVINTRSGRMLGEPDKEVMILVGKLASLAIATAEAAQK